MKILIYLGHPAHYHLFKGTRQNLLARGHQVELAVRSKDILVDLLEGDGIPYLNLLPEGRKDGCVGAAAGFARRLFRLARLLRRQRFDLLVGSDPSMAQAGRLFRIPSIMALEDDARVIPYVAWLGFPFANLLVTPRSCDLGRWEARKIGYEGFQKLAYLHPNQFSPDRNSVPFIRADESYFLVRLSSLSAHHDVGIKGIDRELLRKLVSSLERRGRVVISSERPLEPEFERHRISFPVKDIHHLLSFADLLIGDSQSMAVEAAMLGTPSIRFSDFAGRIGVLEELEHDYQLTFGIPASEPERLLQKVEEILAIPDLREQFARRRARMLREKIDVTAFLTWLIDEYPRSVTMLREDPGVQDRFQGSPETGRQAPSAKRTTGRANHQLRSLAQ